METMKTKIDGVCIRGYARVSTCDQNLAMQIDGLNSYGCTSIYEDEGVSGGIHPLERPNFVAAINGMNAGSVIVVMKLDRLGRSLRDIIETVEHLQGRQIQFVSLTESIQTDNAMGKAFLHFLGLLSELERGLIRERTLLGLAAARKRGQRLGRPFALDSQDIHAAHSAFKMGRMSRVDIAKKYGVSDRTLRRGFERLGLMM